jgi:hypothetical protein
MLATASGFMLIMESANDVCGKVTTNTIFIVAVSLESRMFLSMLMFLKIPQ